MPDFHHRGKVIDRLARELNGQPYSWPDNTCCELIFRFVQEVGGFDLREKPLIKHFFEGEDVFEGKDPLAFIEVGRKILERDDRFKKVSPGRIKTGDFIAIDDKEIFPPRAIGIAHQDYWIFVQSKQFIMPLFYTEDMVLESWRLL